MSWFTATPVTCPECSESFTGHTADSVNIGRMPQARDLVLNGEFHVERCPACDTRVTIERTFLYTDFERGQFVHVFRKRDEADWQRCEQVAGNTFSDGFAGAPPGMQDLSRKCAVRAVFGMAALAEKLRIWDAEFDDAVIELLKLELMTTVKLPTGDRDVEILMHSTARQGSESGQIEFLVRAPDAAQDAEVTIYGASLSRYLELARDRERLMETWPGLFLMPYVGYRRLAREPARSPNLETT